MVRTSITITDDQDGWIDGMIESGAFTSRSEVIRYCIQYARNDDHPDRLTELERKVEKYKPYRYKAYQAVRENTGWLDD